MDEVKEGSPAANGIPLETQLGQPDPTLIDPLQLSSLEPAHTIFVGPEGLRAGWRFLLYVGMWRVFLVLLRTLVPHFQPHGVRGIWQDLIGELEFLASAFLPALVMGAIEKRSLGSYGLPWRGTFGKAFWVGMAWGIVAITILVLAIGGLGDFSLGGLALHGGRILKFAAFWGGFFVIVGLFEEFLLRGYTQFTLTQGIGFWPAALLLSQSPTKSSRVDGDQSSATRLRNSWVHDQILGTACGGNGSTISTVRFAGAVETAATFEDGADSVTSPFQPDPAAPPQAPAQTPRCGRHGLLPTPSQSGRESRRIRRA